MDMNILLTKKPGTAIIKPWNEGVTWKAVYAAAYLTPSFAFWATSFLIHRKCVLWIKTLRKDAQHAVGLFTRLVNSPSEPMPPRRGRWLLKQPRGSAKVLQAELLMKPVRRKGEK